MRRPMGRVKTSDSGNGLLTDLVGWRGVSSIARALRPPSVSQMLPPACWVERPGAGCRGQAAARPLISASGINPTDLAAEITGQHSDGVCACNAQNRPRPAGRRCA
jgi:hypothetical protein